jgi:protein-tyrosine phosphatase
VIDLHSHLLPGVDDGSRSVRQSVQVLEKFVRLGVTDVALTPHLLASQVGDGLTAAHERAWVELAAAAPRGVTLHRGAEVMLDRPLDDRARARKVTLGGTRYILVEFPRMVAREIVTRALREVMSHDLVPVLAHPERYSCCSVDSVAAWRQMGAVMQVDATTLTQPRSRGDRARDLVGAGVADILAGDNHGDERCIATAVDWLADHDGGEQAVVLLETNPRAILRDEPLYEIDPLPGGTGLMRRMRKLFGGT